MWPIEEGLERLSVEGFRHVGIADYRSMAGIERFDRKARELGMEPWLGVTVEVSGRSGISSLARLFCLTPEGYRILCRLGSGAEPLRLEGLACPDLAISLPRAAWPWFDQEAPVIHRFGLVCPEIDARPWNLAMIQQPRVSPVVSWPLRYLDDTDREAYQTLCRIGEHDPDPEAVGSPTMAGVVALTSGFSEWPYPSAPEVLPSRGYQIPIEAGSLDAALTALKKQAQQGLRARGLADATAEQRLADELHVIAQLGFQGYFLLVAELTDWARQQGIRVGPGRGSAAGSLVAYALGITSVNPLQYGLIFERFLNVERGGLPDIDLDVDYARRGELLAHLREHWGTERVAQIGTFGTLGSRAALRDVARVRGVAPDIVQKVMADLELDASQSLVDQHDRLRAKIAPYDPTGHWLQIAERLEGLPRHASIHAAGVVIAPSPVSEWVPVNVDAGALITQMEMASVEHLGLVKLDVLGLRTLAVIDQTEAWIQRMGGAVFPMESVPEDDPKTLKLLGLAETEGIFQLDGQGVKRLLQEMRPTSLKEIIAVVALYRPGPMEAIPEYLAARKNPPPSTGDPIAAIMAETYGVMVYQEQLMAMVRVLGEYTWAEADQFRRAVSKKDHALMAREEARLAARVHSSNGQKWMARLHAFQDYGFNKSHAACYGLVAFYLAYLKAHWPLAFWASELSSLMGLGDRLTRAMRQAAESLIPIALPDINRSDVGFRPSSDQTHLIAGLGLVRGLGLELAERVVAERQRDGAFQDYKDYINRIGRTLDARTDKTLHAAGVFRDLPGSDQGPSQLSWIQDPVTDSVSPIDCVASFGFAWPIADGPVYIGMDGNHPDLPNQIKSWALSHPGETPVVLVVNRERGRRLLVTASTEFAGVQALRDLAGVGRVLQSVKEAPHLHPNFMKP